MNHYILRYNQDPSVLQIVERNATVNHHLTSKEVSEDN